MDAKNGRVALFLLLGIILFSFGCGGDDGGSPESAPEGGSAENESGGGSEGELEGEEELTECHDGTPIGNCSETQPKICDASGNLVDDVETCGCPEGSLQMGDKCIYDCEDGTPLGECSEDKPNYCNLNAGLEQKASLCGCPEGYDIDGEGCRNSCDDGTLKEACSEDTPPYYCNSEYELVLNPPLCGCFEWEFMVSGKCYDPTAQIYSSGDTIWLNENVSAVIENVEDINCDDARYIGLRLTIHNGGEDYFTINEEDVRAYKNRRYRMFMGRPQGCNINTLFRWGSVYPGGDKTGSIYFNMGGGVGDEYSLTISRIYYGSLMRNFNVTLTPED